MTDETMALAAVGAAVSLALPAWMLALWLRGRGINPFRALAKFLPRSAVERLLLACVAVGFFHYGATKETNAPPRGSVELRVESGELRNGQSYNSTLSTFNFQFQLESVTTNDTCSFSAPVGAAVATNWMRRGAADDRMWLYPPGWAFALGDDSVTNLSVFSGGRAKLPGGAAIAPLPATLGIVPEANWGLLGSNAPSLFWHAVEDDGSLLLTWQNVLLHRATTNPVSVQAEFRPTGGVTFRYDLSRLASDDLILGVVPTAGDAALDGPLTRSTTSVSFKSRDEAICDESRAAFEEALGGLDPSSFPEGSTNTVLEHLFYSGTTNGAFAYPQPTEHVAVLRVSVSGTGVGDLLVGGSYVPLVGEVSRRGEKLWNCGNVETAIDQCGIGNAFSMNNPAIPQLHNSTIQLMLPVAKGATVPTYLRGDGTLSVSFDSGEFAFGELPSIAANRCAGWINFPDTRATEPCIHNFATRRKSLSLPASSGADGLSCAWSGAQGVQVENLPPRSATLTASFDARETREITYTLSHPNRLFGQTEYSQTVRFCPRPPDPDPADPDPPEDPSWFSEGDPPDEEDDDIEYIDENDPEQPGVTPADGDEDEVCPVHEVPYEQCASLHAADYTNAVENVAHLGGVLYIREPPVTGDQIYLEVSNEHVNCCPCPGHWTNCVSVAYRSPRVRVTGPGGQDFSSTDTSCTVNVAGVRPSRAVGDAGLAFARNGEIYEQRDYTVFGVGIRRDGVPLSRYNELDSQFGYPMTVCTNDWRAPTIELVTNVRLSSGTVHLEFAGATAPFALWYRRRGESEYRKLLDSETSPAKDIPISVWRSVVAGVASGSAASVPVLVTSSAPGTVRLVLRYWTVADGAFAQDVAVQRITSVNPPLLADADGDWSLGEGDVAAQLAGRTFRFWTNEDCHKGDYVGQSSDFAPNTADYVVNGCLDLVNLFPVKLDLKPFVDAWGGAAKFILWSPSSGSLRFCGLDAQPDSAWAYQTNDVYTTIGDPVYAADLIPVDGEGVTITPGDYLGLGNAPGVLAFEAAREVSQSDALILFVMAGDDVLFTYSLPLAISSVDNMYRWRGLRHVCGGASSIPDRTGEPWNMPDAEACDIDVFFLHGFNVSESDARNWSRQVFKRLWLSGSRARFHGFSWYGDYNLIGSAFNGLHYHQDVYHALKTASAFKSHVEAAQPASSKRIIMAHSLGNMVASEALRQGLAVGKYFMFNAAVASETIDGTLQASSDEDDGYLKYVPSDWYGYTNLCWAANWHRWFKGDANDSRGRMGWPDYFSDALTNAVTVCNYYSSGDEIFEEMPSTPSALSGVFHWPTFQTSWPFVDLSSMFTPSVNAWQKQEVLKGVDNVAGTLAGGWGFHYVSNATPAVTTWRIYTSEEACAMVEDGSIVTNAVFARNATAMFNPSATQDAQWETLAKYVPAVSGAVGKRSIFAVYGRDIDMDLDSEQGVERHNGWGRNNPQYGASWLHSDMKNMAYWYVFPLYRHLKEELR